MVQIMEITMKMMTLYVNVQALQLKHQQKKKGGSWDADWDANQKTKKNKSRNSSQELVICIQ